MAAEMAECLVSLDPIIENLRKSIFGGKNSAAAAFSAFLRKTSRFEAVPPGKMVGLC
jgi:hypothetical protein